MESAAVLRPFNCSVGAVSYVRSIIERPSMVAVHNASWTTFSKSHTKHFSIEGKLVSYSRKWTGTVSCAKTSETAGAAESDVMSDIRPQGLLEKNYPRRATFPKGFEHCSSVNQELVMNVCDKTQIAELKLKVGDFELHLMRNIGATTAPMPDVSPTIPAAVPSKPVIESAPASPPATPPKSSTEKVSPFINVSKKSAKLSALEASGSSAYVLVSSPTVGSFRRGRTLKGKKQPPICKEGDVVKEGQVIGFLDQFGTELPVKSDVAGEVLKLLIEDGDAVGYGDALIAVLPSFHGIN